MKGALMRGRARLFASCVALLLCRAVSAAQPPTIAVSAIEADLFLGHSGTFATVTDDMALSNTIIGAGSAPEPSTSTLVKVLVIGPPGDYPSTTSVSLIVRGTGRKGRRWTLRQRLGGFSREGRQYVGFWLPDTGCGTLVLRASVSTARASVVKTIPFECGE